ncbi:helix-turn-helix domain-containing protein [Rhodovulum steppense]|uniref:Homeodomain-like domain-containing protein n=1 Tax=Rhodovulum steppense TaxID=540251 RepID=A0A4R1YNP1_9RHOB|nr:helix-turn-helix domain-containing protein [Rhodovulum steppense]TCM79648.1 hypothetical protein EV216_12237 [Rhodovulum steppense]
MRDSYPKPPAHIEPYVRVLGSKLAMQFLLTFGGAELYIGRNPTERSRVVQLVGVDLAAELSETLRQTQNPRIPLAKPWVAACLAHEGRSVADIARTLHASDTTVRGWLGKDPYRPSPARWGDA